MRYQIRVAGKIFEGTDLRILLKRAVEAKRAQTRALPAREPSFPVIHRRLSIVNNGG